MPLNFMKKRDNEPFLWTNAFNNLIGGSFMAFAGFQVISIALGLLVLDITGSNLYYSIVLTISNVSAVLVPIFTAALMDRFSKKKMLCRTDLLTAVLLLFMLIIYELGYMKGITVLFCSACLGVLTNIYRVVYQGFFPKIVDKRLYAKAYSVESFMSTFAKTGSLIGIACYTAFGIRTALIVSAVCYLLAAAFESRINFDDPFRVRTKASDSVRQYIKDNSECWQYLKNNNGLLMITLLGFFTFYADGAMFTIALPHFKFGFANGEFIYMVVMGLLYTGQSWGGMLGYGLHIKPEKRYKWYFICLVLQLIAAASFMYYPWIISAVQMFVFGILSIITYSIKATVVNSSLKKDMLTRYNGFNQSITMLGYLCGTLLGGAFTEFYPAPAVMTVIALFILGICLSFFVDFGESMSKVFAVDNSAEIREHF